MPPVFYATLSSNFAQFKIIGVYTGVLQGVNDWIKIFVFVNKNIMNDWLVKHYIISYRYDASLCCEPNNESLVSTDLWTSPLGCDGCLHLILLFLLLLLNVTSQLGQNLLLRSGIELVGVLRIVLLNICALTASIIWVI